MVAIIVTNSTAEEIAALAMALQGRQEVENGKTFVEAVQQSIRDRIESGQSFRQPT